MKNIKHKNTGLIKRSLYQSTQYQCKQLFKMHSIQRAKKRNLRRRCLEIEHEFLCELKCSQVLLLSKCKNYNRLINKKKKLNDFIYSIKEMKKNKKRSFDYL